MRGGFNATCSLTYGPESPYGPPGVTYLSGVPCRCVPQREIFQRDFPLTLTHSWMTIEAHEPNTPEYKSSSLGEWHARIYTADIVSIAALADSPWYALRAEDMEGPAQAPYWRVALLPVAWVDVPHWLPPSPPPPPSPAGSCSAATPAPLPISYAGTISMMTQWWFSFMVAAGSPRSLTVSGGTSGGTSARVYDGGCGSLFNVAGPLIGNGTLNWTPLVSEQQWVQVVTASTDTINVLIS